MVNKNKFLLVVFLSMMGMGLCVTPVFTQEYITLDDYEAVSLIDVDYYNASVLIGRVNNLLAMIRANPSDIVLIRGARDYGHAKLHPYSRAIDLRWNSSLYEKMKQNITGSGLRLELIEGIRKKGQTDHIHLDIGREGEPNDVQGGRTFMP